MARILDVQALLWVYGISGILLFLWGWAQLIIKWAATTELHKVANPKDILNLTYTGPSDNPAGPPFSLAFLFGPATVAEGFFLWAIAVMWWFKSDFTHQDILENRNWVRWIRWALTDALFFAAIGFLVKIEQVWIIIGFALVAIGLNFAQAANETENALIKGNYAQIEEDFVRFDAWAVATAFFLFLLVLVDWTLAKNFDILSVGVKVAVIAWQAIYLILHLLILGLLTNFNKTAVSATTREIIFEVVRFVSILFVTIAAYY